MRKARNKSPNYKYHIRVRGMDELILFRDNEDKDKYISLVNKYAKLNSCNVFAFCLMNTHGHFFIDPNGYDISKLMHKINLCYAQYYNKKYSRGGHVFRGRFESDPVCSPAYCLALSAYIHNNPKDIIDYRGREEYFYYSSYGIYAGLRTNFNKFIDTELIFSLMLVNSLSKAKEKYIKFVKNQHDKGSIINIIDCLSSGDFNIPTKWLES